MSDSGVEKQRNVLGNSDRISNYRILLFLCSLSLFIIVIFRIFKKNALKIQIQS